VRSVPYVWVEKKRADPAAQCTGMAGTEFLEHPCDAPHPSECDPAGDPRACLDGIPQDNCGLELVTVLHGIYATRTRWCAFWMPSETVDPADYELCVAGVTAGEVATLSDSEVVPVEFDDGPEAGGFGRLVAQYFECCDAPTRPVCELPGP
jgi:hypothetical protein